MANSTKDFSTGHPRWRERYLSRRSMAMGLCLPFAAQALQTKGDRWLVYYGSTEQAETFRPYSCLILDSRYHPPLSPLASMGKRLIGYVSVGEASPDYTYFGDLKAEGLLLRPSAVWQGNQYIDIRDNRWLQRLTGVIIPSILAQGFQGLFLDTLDSPLYLEQMDRTTYAGMADAAATIVKTIRRSFPGLTVILNRAYKLLDAVSEDIDVAVGESVYTTFNFQTKKYGFVETGAYRAQVQLLQRAIKRNSRLRIFTLDYWEPSDLEGVSRIYREERANGFVPYVATIDLTRIVREPFARR